MCSAWAFHGQRQLPTSDPRSLIQLLPMIAQWRKLVPSLKSSAPLAQPAKRISMLHRHVPALKGSVLHRRPGSSIPSASPIHAVRATHPMVTPPWCASPLPRLTIALLGEATGGRLITPAARTARHCLRVTHPSPSLRWTTRSWRGLSVASASPNPKRTWSSSTTPTSVVWPVVPRSGPTLLRASLTLILTFVPPVAPPHTLPLVRGPLETGAGRVPNKPD